LAISATAIRELVAAGRDPQFLLPDRVIDLIRRHGLYQPSIHHTGN
jgi:nicotinate-nucleotide adenylyltransferase